jgi:DNA-binding response OmpR family regulator
VSTSTLSGSARVLLIEDDQLTREVLAAALSGSGYDVHAEADGLRIERAAGGFRPDIALVDIDLGDNAVDGLVVARRLRSTVGEVPVLFLTGATGTEDVLAAFSAGADDYVTKPFVMAELLARMQAVLRRVGRGGGRELLECADLVVDTSAHEAVRAGAPIDLTPREFALLVALMRHQNVVLSKVQLLNEVWGFEHYDLNVVEVHMSALRRKLEEHGPRLIRTVRSVGYVLRPVTA